MLPPSRDHDGTPCLGPIDNQDRLFRRRGLVHLWVRISLSVADPRLSLALLWQGGQISDRIHIVSSAVGQECSGRFPTPDSVALDTMTPRKRPSVPDVEKQDRETTA